MSRLLGAGQAWADPIPNLVIAEAPTATPLYGDPATLNLTFDNIAAPGEVGYNPLIELVLPPEITGIGALVSPIFGSINGSSQVVPVSGQVSNPYTGEVLSGLPVAATYVVYEIPIGSTTPEQPALSFSVTLDIDPLHAPQSSLANSVTAIAVWALGADPLDNPGVDPVVRNDATGSGISVAPAANLQGAAATTDIVPVVYLPTKTLSEIDGNGTATGPNFPVTYTLDADIGDPITLTPFTFSETVPDDLRFTGITDITVNASSGDPDVTIEFERYPCGSGTVTLFGPAPLSTISFPVVHPDGTADLTQPPGDVPGGCFRVIFDSLTGESISQDVSVEYDSYVPKFDALGALVLPEPTGGTRLVSNTVTTSVVDASGPYGSLSLVGQDITTPPANTVGTSLDTQKGVGIVVDTGPVGASPGDVVRFTISAQVSDYFAHDQIAIHDTLGDGFDFNILNPGNAQITLGRENGSTLGSTPIPFTLLDVDPAPDSTAPGEEYPFPAAGTLLVTQNARPGEASGTSPGFTTLVFDISNFLGHECSVSGGACSVDADCPGVETCVQTGEMEGGFIDLSSAATGFRTGIDDDTRLTITFDATIQEAYENSASYTEDASIDSGDALDNVEITSGFITSDPGGQFDTGTSPDSAGIEIIRPVLEKELVAIDGSASLPSPLQVLRGEDVTYSLKITIPVGDLETLSLQDYLPIPVFNVADPEDDGVPSGWTFDNSVLPAGTFPAVGVAAFGSDTTVNPPDFDPTANPPAIATDATANSIQFDFPDLITFQPPTPQTIVVQILFTVRVTADPFADNLFLANFARAVYGNSINTLTVEDVAPLFKIRSPVLDVTKGISATDQAGVISPPPSTLPVDGNLTGADAGDTVTYVITVENSGGSPAYEVTVSDPEVAGMDPGSCSLISVTEGDGVTLRAYTGDLFGAGIVLSDPLAVNDENPAGGGPPFSDDTALVTVTCVLAPDVEPSTSVVNTATVSRFAAKSGGANFVDPGDPLNDDASAVVVENPAIAKAVESVVPEAAGPGNVTSGDTVVYAITVTLPEGETNSLVITDTLPAGFVYQAPAAVDTAGPGFAGVLPVPAITVSGAPATGQIVELDFGTVTVTDDNNAATNSFIIRITALVDGSYAANDGLPAGQTKTNSVDLDYATGPTLSDSADLTFVEPDLAITKDMAPPTADAADTVTITIVVDNNGTGPAYDVVVTDVLDGALFDLTALTSINEGTTPADFTYSYDGVDTVSYTIDAAAAIPAGGSRTFTFTANIRDDVVTSSTYSNSADVDGDSQDGSVTGERAVTDTGGDTVGIVQSGVSKSITATFENHTDPGDASLASNPPVAIGERLTYRVVFTIPEGVTNAVRLADVLPTGIAHIAGTATLARSSTSLVAANDPGSINSAGAGVAVSVALSGITGEILVDLGDVTNSDTDNGVAETYTLVLDALVLNSAGNNAGTLLRNRGRIRFQNASATELLVNSSYVDVHVAEPVPTVTKTALPATASGGDAVTFTIVIRNNTSGANAATGFDWTFSDVLPAEYINAALVSVDTSNAPGAVAGAAFLAPPNENELAGTIDQLDPGEYVTVIYTADVDPATPFATVITNTALTDTTSLPGANGTAGANPNPAGAANGERTGAGGVNDLSASDTAAVTVDVPTISKSLVGAQAFYAIGETATFEISVGVPVGSTGTFVVSDIMPADLDFVPGSLVVTPPAGFSGANAPFTEANPAFYSLAGNTLTFDFGAVTAAANGTLTIAYDALVENVASNQNTVTLANSATLEIDDPDVPGGTITEGPATVQITIGEPNLDMSKEIVSGAVGSQAGDTVRWGVEIGNDLASSNTTAFGVVWTDILPDGGGGAGASDGLEQISNVAVTISGGNVYQTGTANPVTAADAVISTSLNTDDTIAFNPMDIEPGARIRIEFDSVVGANAVQGASLDNQTSAVYDSILGGGGRDGSDGPGVDDDDDADLDNYEESASQVLILDTPIAIDKTVAAPTYTIGEDVTYTVRVSLFEGVTESVLVTDELPLGLLYQSHSIALGHMPGISIGNPGYATPTFGVGGGGGATLTFDFGDITNVPNGDGTDDWIDIEIVARVENIAGNQNGDVLENNAFLLYGAGATRLDFDSDGGTPGVQGLPIDVVEPELTVTKVAVPSSQALGDVVTFTVTVAHIGGSSTADAYDLVISDTIPAGLTYVPGSASPPPADVSYVDPVLTVVRSSLTLADGSFVFTYQATVDSDAVVGTPLVNSLDVVWASIPGATGAADDGRTGSGGVNDYLTSDNSPVTPSTAAFVDAEKTVTLFDDADFSGTVTPGDTLAYAVVLTNDSVDVTSLVFTDTIPVQTSYVPGSLGSDLGVPDDSGAPTLVVDVGGMVAGSTVNIGFRVTVNPGTASGTVISNQGSIDSDQTVPEPTDEDGIDSNGDQPTDVIVGGPPSLVNDLYVAKYVSLETDADVSGDVTPGDTLRYLLIFFNEGDQDLTNVSLTDSIPTGLTGVLASGLVTGAGATINVTATTVAVDIPTIVVGDFEAAQFDVTVDGPPLYDGSGDGDPARETFVNQGVADSDQTSPVDTDGNGDPSDGSQPTEIDAVDGAAGDPAIDVEKRVTLFTDNDSDGLVDPLDVLEYSITVRNTGSAAATNVQLADNPMPNDTTVVAGSASTSQGLIVVESPLLVNIGTMNPGAVVVVTFRVTVDGGTPGGTIIVNQANVTGDNFAPEDSDDNGNDGDGKNPNLTPVDTGGAGGPGSPTFAKTISATTEADSTTPAVLIGEIVTFQLAAAMPPGTTREVTLSDTLPAGMTYVSGSGRLARTFETGLSSSANPGGINGVATGVFTALADGSGIAVSGQNLSVFLGDVIDSDNDANSETYVVEYQAYVDNVVGNQRSTVLTNAGELSYLDALLQVQTLSDDVPVTVTEPELSIAKAVAPNPVSPLGQTVTFTLTVSASAAANTATGYDVNIGDPLPAAFTNMSALLITPSAGIVGVTDNSAGTTVDVTVDEFPPGEQVVISFTADVTPPFPGGFQDNTASTTWTSLPGDNGSGGANPNAPGSANGERTGSGGVNDHNDADLVTVETPVLFLAKSDDPEPVEPGQALTYTLVYGNAGSVALTNVVLTETYDPQTVFSAAVPPPDVGDNQWNIGTLDPGESGSIEITVIVDALALDGDILLNSATIVDDSGNSDTQDEETPVVVVDPTDAYIEINKTVNVSLAPSGGEMIYSLEVVNNGPATSFDTVASDTLPLGLTFVSSVPVPDVSADPLYQWNVGDLAPGASTTIDVSVSVDATAPAGYLFDNCATAAGDDTPGAGAPGATYEAEGCVAVPASGPADLEILKSDLSDPVFQTQNLSYQLTVNNLGPGIAPGVIVVDTLDPTTTYVSDTGGCVEGPVGTLSCALGDMASGASVVFDVTVNVTGSSATAGSLQVSPCDGSEDLCNLATVSSSAFDPDLGNNDADEPTDVTPVADMRVTKVDPAEPIPAGTSMTYTLRVRNLGPSDAENVVVTDTLDSWTSYLSDTGGCVEGPVGTLTCDLGTIASGDLVLVDVTVAIDAAAPIGSSKKIGDCDGSEDICNAVSVSADTDDLDLTNNSDDEPTDLSDPPPLADLELAKTDAVDPIQAGGVQTYTLTVTNNGPFDAADVVVTDTLDANTSYVSSTRACTEGPVGTLNCALGSIPALASASFNITVSIAAGAPTAGSTDGAVCDAGADLCNSAVVSSSTADDDPTNNSAEQATNVVAASSSSDLSLIKIDTTPEPVPPGSNVDYLITVTNNGPDAADDVTVIDVMGSYLSYVSDTGGCVESPTNVLTCSLGTLPAFSSTNFTVTANVALDAPISGTVQDGSCDGLEDTCNSASVSSASGDSDAGNNADGEPTDISPNLSCGDAVIDPGEQCEPPGAEICNNGVDDNGDALVDCADPLCPSGVPSCDSNCLFTNPCTPILNDPAMIRIYDDTARSGARKDFVKIHGRFVPYSPLDPYREGFIFMLSNANGAIYSARLFPGDMEIKREEFRFKDKRAKRTGLGIRGGIFKLRIRPRFDSGFLGYGFSIKAYGDLSRAILPRMTTQVYIGDDVAFLTAQWSGDGRRWKLRQADY